MPRGYGTREVDMVLAQAERDHRAKHGPSIYDQMWEELDRAFDVLKETPKGDPARPAREQYCAGLAYGVKLMGPWHYARTTSAVVKEAARRWEARRVAAVGACEICGRSDGLHDEEECFK